MGIACQIFKNSDGTIHRIDAINGEESKLYKDALRLLGSEEDALNVWATAYTPEFKSYYGYWDSGFESDAPNVDTNGEPFLDDVMAYLKKDSSIVYPMAGRDIREMQSVMASTGISNIRSLQERLSEAFYRNGRYIINEANLRSSGLYTESEIIHLVGSEEARGKLRDFIQMINDTIDYLPNQEKEDYYLSNKNNFPRYAIAPDGTYNSAGKSNIYPPSILYKEIRNLAIGAESVGDVTSRLYALSDKYPSFYNRLINDDSVAMEILSDVRGLKKVSAVELDENGNVVEKPSKRVDKLRGFSSVNLKALSDTRTMFFDFMLTDNWEDVESVTEKLKEIEKKAVEFGIDVIGIAEAYRTGQNRNSEDYLNLTAALDDFIFGIHHMDMSADRELSTRIDKILGKEEAGAVVKTDTLGSAGQVFFMENSPLSDKEMYEDKGYLHIGNGIYHKVGRIGNLSEMYNSMAELIKYGSPSFKLPLKAYPEKAIVNGAVSQDKLGNMEVGEIADSIRKYTLSSSSVDSTEEMELSKILFGTKDFASKEENVDIQRAFTRYTNTKNEAIDENIPQDLYKEYLENKLNDTELYHSLYQYLDFKEDGSMTLISSDAGTLLSIDSSAEGKTREKLMEYALSSNDKNLFNLFFMPNESMHMINDVFYHYLYTRNPSALKELKNGKIRKEGDVLLIDDVYDSFVKVKGVVYSKVNEGNEGSFYKEISGTSEDYVREVRDKAKPTYINRFSVSEEPSVKDEFPISKEESREIDRKIECR